MRQAFHTGSYQHEPIAEVSATNRTNSHAEGTECLGYIEREGSSLTMICLDHPRYLVQCKTSEPHTEHRSCTRGMDSSRLTRMHFHDEVVGSLCNCRTRHDNRLMVRVCPTFSCIPDETSAINRLKPAVLACVMLVKLLLSCL